jgi:hypothetical protein
MYRVTDTKVLKDELQYAGPLGEGAGHSPSSKDPTAGQPRKSWKWPTIAVGIVALGVMIRPLLCMEYVHSYTRILGTICTETDKGFER